MELTLSIKGHLAPERADSCLHVFRQLEGRCGPLALENAVNESLPEASEAVDALLTHFEEAEDQLVLEELDHTPPTVTLSFMGSYTLEEAEPLLLAWLTACGLEQLEVTPEWV